MHPYENKTQDDLISHSQQDSSTIRFHMRDSTSEQWLNVLYICITETLKSSIIIWDIQMSFASEYALHSYLYFANFLTMYNFRVYHMPWSQGGVLTSCWHNINWSRNFRHEKLGPRDSGSRYRRRSGAGVEILCACWAPGREDIGWRARVCLIPWSLWRVSWRGWCGENKWGMYIRSSDQR